MKVDIAVDSIALAMRCEKFAAGLMRELMPQLQLTDETRDAFQTSIARTAVTFYMACIEDVTRSLAKSVPDPDPSRRNPVVRTVRARQLGRLGNGRKARR